MTMLNTLKALALATLLTGCTALQSYPGELPDPKTVDWSLYEINTGSFAEVSGACSKMGYIPGTVAGCTCYTGDLKPRSEQHGPASCHIPMGKIAVVWSINDKRTLDHELAHAFYGAWH